MKCSDLPYHCKSARLCVRHPQMKTHLNYFIKFHWQCYKKLLDRRNCFLKVTYSTSVLVSLNISSSKINYITRERQKYKSLLLMTTVQGNSLPLRCNYLSFGVVSPPQRSPHASLWSLVDAPGCGCLGDLVHLQMSVTPVASNMRKVHPGLFAHRHLKSDNVADFHCSPNHTHISWVDTALLLFYLLLPNKRKNWKPVLLVR